jgi:hypothetical protein
MHHQIILKLSGGLGNQLFQICAGIYIQNQNSEVLSYDISNLIKNQRIKQGSYTRQFAVADLTQGHILIRRKYHWFIDFLIIRFRKRFLRNTFIFEGDSSDAALKKINFKTKEVYGFFQDSRLVVQTWDELLEKMKKSEKFSPIVSAKPIDRIAIHARFGDYSDDARTREIYGLTQISYYLKSIEFLTKASDTVQNIVVVTDDIGKAKLLFDTIKNFGIIEYISNTDPLLDLLEIARSTNVILSNSTFSWWGGWIANQIHDAKIVYPRPWYANPLNPELPIYVDEWHAIEREYDSK